MGIITTRSNIKPMGSRGGANVHSFFSKTGSGDYFLPIAFQLFLITEPLRLKSRHNTLAVLKLCNVLSK